MDVTTKKKESSEKILHLEKLNDYEKIRLSHPIVFQSDILGSKSAGVKFHYAGASELGDPVIEAGVRVTKQNRPLLLR